MQKDACGIVALCTLHVFVNNASMRTVCKMIEKEQWPPNNSIFECGGYIMSGDQCTKLFWNLRLKPKTVSELKVALGKMWDNFLQVQLIKLIRVLEIVWQEYVKSDRRHSEHFSLLKKCLHCICTFLNFWKQFLITSQLLSCHD